jgi:hypothetical protein
VWVSAGRVYVAALDSTSSARLAIGATVEFVARGKTIASGDITGALGRELIVAELTSGSLAKQKHLDRVGVITHAQASAPLPTLRVGFPSRRRSNLLFSCGTMTLRPPFAPGVYRADTLSASRYRWVSPSAVPGSSTFPDTIYAHLFDDSADEEIALERGDINVAVFWPGELSRHMREYPGAWNVTWATRARGVVAILPLDWPYRVPWVLDPKSNLKPTQDPPDSPADTVGLSHLNDDLFRGDLGPPPWEQLSSGQEPATAATKPPRRFVVDPACPGREVLERYLKRRSHDPDSTRVARFFYLDAPVISAHSAAIALTDYVVANATSSAQGRQASAVAEAFQTIEYSDVGELWAGRAVTNAFGVIPIFTIRCPIACTSELRDRLTLLSRELVDLMDCGAATGSP